jgi:hypothetical protein
VEDIMEISKHLKDKFGRYLINSEVGFDSEQFCVVFSAFKEFYESVEIDMNKQTETFICPDCGKELPISAKCSKGYCLSCSGNDF